MNTGAVTRQIGTHLYGCRKLPAGVGFRVLARLMNLIGPSIKQVSGGQDALSSIVGTLLENEKLSDQLEYFAQTFAAYSTLEEPNRSQELSAIYDVHFAGNYFELVQWLIFCFEVNHGGFLAEAGLNVQNLLAAVQAQLSSRSPKQSATSGRSGQSSFPAGSTKPTETSPSTGR